LREERTDGLCVIGHRDGERVGADAGAEEEVGGGSLTTWVSGGAMAGQMEDDCGFSSAGKEREGMVARGA
jgi:hypothetical protein